MMYTLSMWRCKEGTIIIDDNNSNIKNLSKIVYHLDEPMSDTSIIPFYQLCKVTIVILYP